MEKLESAERFCHTELNNIQTALTKCQGGLSIKRICQLLFRKISYVNRSDLTWLNVFLYRLIYLFDT